MKIKTTTIDTLLLFKNQFLQSALVEVVFSRRFDCIRSVLGIVFDLEAFIAGVAVEMYEKEVVGMWEGL